ncbi:MAG: response regulator [Planctomycetota bacterium]
MRGANRQAVVILLAEDDAGDQELIRRALEEGGVPVELHVVQDGEQALDYLLRRGRYSDPRLSPRPHLMLLDLNMPKLDGKQVLREMLEQPELRRLPVVALTTSRDEKDVRETYELGANSYVRKPERAEQYVSLVRSLEAYWFDLVVLPP